MSYKSSVKRNVVVAACTAALMFATATAQAKCKYQTDAVNIISNEKVRWTNWSTFTLTLRADRYILVTGITEGDRKYLGLRMHLESTRPDRPTKDDLNNTVVVPAGATVMLLMADESIVELHSEEQFTGDTDFTMHNAHKYGMVTDAFVKYPVTDDILSALVSQRVKIIRITTNDGDIDFEFGKKGSKKMQKTLACIQ